MKLCGAPYGLNERGDSWVKLKPDYMEGVTDTLDVVIVGGYLGDGSVRSPPFLSSSPPLHLSSFPPLLSF